MSTSAHVGSRSIPTELLGTDFDQLTRHGEMRQVQVLVACHMRNKGNLQVLEADNIDSSWVWSGTDWIATLDHLWVHHHHVKWLTLLKLCTQGMGRLVRAFAPHLLAIFVVFVGVWEVHRHVYPVVVRECEPYQWAVCWVCQVSLVLMCPRVCWDVYKQWLTHTRLWPGLANLCLLC